MTSASLNKRETRIIIDSRFFILEEQKRCM